MNRLVEYIKLMPNLPETISELIDRAEPSHTTRKIIKMVVMDTDNKNKLIANFIKHFSESRGQVNHRDDLLYAIKEFGDENLYMLARDAFPGVEPNEQLRHEHELIDYLRRIDNMPEFITQIHINCATARSYSYCIKSWHAFMNTVIDYQEIPSIFLHRVKHVSTGSHFLHSILVCGDERLYELAQNVFPGIEPVRPNQQGVDPYATIPARTRLEVELAQPKMIDGKIEKTHTKLLRMANIIGDENLILFVEHIINNMDVYDGTYRLVGLVESFLRYVENREMEGVLLNKDFTDALNDPTITQCIRETYGGENVLAEQINEILVIR